MSIEAISWALNTAPVDEPSAAAVLIGVANHAGPDGRGAFPSVARLVRYTRLSERTVREQLDILEAAKITSPCDPAIIAAYIKRGDQRPQGWDLDLTLTRDNPEHVARFRAAVQAVKDERKERRKRLEEKRKEEAEERRKALLEASQENGVRPSHPAPESQRGATVATNGVRPSQERGATVAPEPSFKPSVEPSFKNPGSFAGAQEPAGQPPVQETLEGIPDPATPPQLTVLPGGQPEPSIDQQARTIADRYWAWLKEQDVPAPAANDRGRGTPYVKFVSMVRGRLKNGWARVEIENALIDLFDNRNKAFPAAGVLDEKLVERRRGRTGGKSRRVMYRDEQWDDPALLAEVEQWNQESAYGRTRPTVPAMTDEELQAAWDELGAPRREANR